MHQHKLHEELRALTKLISQVEDSELRRELLLAVAEMLHALADEDGQWETDKATPQENEAWPCGGQIMDRLLLPSADHSQGDYCSDGNNE